MTTSTEVLARDRDHEFILGSEERFPLRLTSSSAPRWDAYEMAIREVWDPEDDDVWSGFDPAAFSPEDRAAGALVWSHRAWIEYPAIAESEAVLIRACLEPGLEVDFKYCMSMRAVERARSTDLSHMLAKKLGGYEPAPTGPELVALLDDDLVRRVLHARVDFDCYIAAHLIAQGEIDLAMWVAGTDGATAPVNRLMSKVITDKQRMLDVAWSRIEHTLPDRDTDLRDRAGRTISAVLETEEFQGRQVPALLASGRDRERLGEAYSRAAAAGLGAATPDRQVEAARAATSTMAARFSNLGVDVRVPA